MVETRRETDFWLVILEEWGLDFIWRMCIRILPKYSLYVASWEGNRDHPKGSS